MSEDDKKLEHQESAAESNNDSNEQIKLEVENKENFKKQDDNISEERILDGNS